MEGGRLAAGAAGGSDLQVPQGHLQWSHLHQNKQIKSRQPDIAWNSIQFYLYLDFGQVDKNKCFIALAKNIIY
jgi:hypothetical protein